MASENQWAYDIESLVYSVVKAKKENSLKTKYPNIKFTQDEESDSTAKFPTVLIQSMEPIEKNSDLEKKKIYTVRFTTQVTVTTNTKRIDALRVAQELAQQYKDLLFGISPLPFVRKSGKVWTAIFRASRTFDWNDKL